MKVKKNTRVLLELRFVPWINTLASIAFFFASAGYALWNLSEGQPQIAFSASVIGLVVSGTLFFLVRPVDLSFDRTKNKLTKSERTIFLPSVEHELDLEKITSASLEKRKTWYQNEASRIVLSVEGKTRSVPLSPNFYGGDDAEVACKTINEWLSASGDVTGP